MFYYHSFYFVWSYLFYFNLFILIYSSYFIQSNFIIFSFFNLFFFILLIFYSILFIFHFVFHFILTQPLLWWLGGGSKMKFPTISSLGSGAGKKRPTNKMLWERTRKQMEKGWGGRQVNYFGVFGGGKMRCC